LIKLHDINQLNVFETDLISFTSFIHEDIKSNIESLKHGQINSFTMDERYVLTGSDDNTARLYDKSTGKCILKLSPDFKFNVRWNPRILVSPVSVVNMNSKYIAIG